MMKKVKAFTVIEALVVVAILAILAALCLPDILGVKHRKDIQASNLTLKVGDSVYIESLGVTGVVNRSRAGVEWSYIDLIVKSTNGTVIMLKDVDAHIVKKVPPSLENEWQR